MTGPLMETRALYKSFPVSGGPFAGRQILQALAGIDMAIAPGETLGIAGESGCGKSTLARLLVQLLTPDSGSVIYRGMPLEQMSRADLLAFRQQVQLVFQDPYASLNPRQQVGEIIGEPLAIHRSVNRTSQREQVHELMTRVGLAADQYHRYPHEFSGGQRQRIGIARALAVSPRLLIADEPVSALDLSVQAQIMNLLLELQSELGLAMIFIAHDLSVIRHMSDRVAIMYLGRIVESGSREQIFNGTLHPYSQALLSAIPHLSQEGTSSRIILSGDPPSPMSPPGGCPFHPRCPYAEHPLCSKIAPPLEEKEPGHLSACHLSGKIFR